MIAVDHWVLDRIYTPIAVLFRYLGVDQWALSRNCLMGGWVMIIGAGMLQPKPWYVRLLLLMVAAAVVFMFLIRDWKLIQMLSISDVGPLVARDQLWLSRVILLIFYGGLFVISPIRNMYDFIGELGMVLYLSCHYFMAVVMPPPPPPKTKRVLASI